MSKKNNKNAEQWYKIINGWAEKEKLPREELLKICGEEASKAIAKIDPDAEIVFEIDDEKKIVNIFNKNRCVVKNDFFETEDYPQDSQISFITLEEAKKIDKNAKEDDILKTPIDLITILNNSKDEKIKKSLKVIKDLIEQRKKILFKKITYEKYKDLIGEPVKIQFSSKNHNGSWNVLLVGEQITAYLPADLVSSKRIIHVGSKATAIIEKVEEEAKLSQIQVSLDSPAIVAQVFKNEIPEIHNGLIEIVNIARKPGERTKVSFRKTDKSNSDFDLYGSIIGEKGSRINNVVQALDGENIDVIIYDDDLKTYIKNAMSPAKVVDIVAKENKENNFYVITINKTPAIGKGGVNVYLASNLTNTRLDILSVTEAKTANILFDESKIAELEQPIFKARKYSNHRHHRNNNYFNNSSINMEDFDKDISLFEEQQDLFANSEMDDLNFEDLFEKHSKETNDKSIETIKSQTGKVSTHKSEKITKEDYKKAKESLKDFKVDKDLAEFGLDEDLDLSDFEDEDWD